MQPEQLEAVFNRQAAGYDSQWEKLAPIRDALDLVVAATLCELPVDARILAVGVGTGVELAHLAGRFPRWSFTAVDPSGAMLDLCRRRAAQDGFARRCTFHEGYLQSLEDDDGHDAATCLLVSQFILERDVRSDFFATIAARLLPGGVLVSSDLASGTRPDDFETLLRTWLAVMVGSSVSTDRLDAARAAYARDVAVLPPSTVASLIEKGGFSPPVQIFQAGLLHAWSARRACPDAAAGA